MWHAEILGFIHDHEVERPLSAFAQLRREVGQHGCACDHPALGQSGSDGLEDGPERGAPGLRQTRLASQALHIPIVIRGFQLPGVDRIRPFRPQETETERLIAGRRARLGDQAADLLIRGQSCRPEMPRRQPAADSIDGVDFEPFGESRLGADQASELGAQRIRQRLGEGRQQDATLRMSAREKDRAMQRDDGLPGAGRPADARRAVELALDPLRCAGWRKMVHLSQGKAPRGPMDDQADVAADPYRPEVLIPRLVEFVKREAGVGRVDLQVERRGFDGLLLVAREAGETVGEGVGDAEVHQLTASPTRGRGLASCRP